MSFQSILRANGASSSTTAEPDYFHDLNLDQIVASITAGRDEYDLKPFFHHRLSAPDAIAYRQEVMRDAQKPPVLQCLNAFAMAMRGARERLAVAEKCYYKQQKQRWFMHAVESYCGAVCSLDAELQRLDLDSRGLGDFCAYMRDYVASPRFNHLKSTLERLTEALGKIRYSILIRDNGFKVRRYEDEADYSVEVTRTFEKFRQGAAKDYSVEYKNTRDMDHIEAQVLEFVALLYAELFNEIDAFCLEQQNFQDQVIARFDREIQFYISYLEYTRAFEGAALSFCYPALSTTSKTLRSEAGFDLALAGKLLKENGVVVCNDFHLEAQERIFLVSGPNQGGKTTFSRMFGQLHHIASLGCPVPGRVAQLFLADRIFTHYEREENIATLRGKLQDDLVRIHEILQNATPQSIIILNEIFNSTTLRDALFLARRVISEIVEKGIICVCVTFLDELTQVSDAMVSMVSTVVPDDPATRTYRVIRRPPDGRSYAISIAQKYRLTYDDLIARIPAPPSAESSIGMAAGDAP